jgi:hypothetical protein
MKITQINYQNEIHHLQPRKNAAQNSKIHFRVTIIPNLVQPWR